MVSRDMVTECSYREVEGINISDDFCRFAGAFLSRCGEEAFSRTVKYNVGAGLLRVGFPSMK